MNALELNTLATIALVHLIATAMPGPNVLLVLSTAITRRRRDVAAVIAGIAVSDAAWAMAAMIGISVVFAEMTWLYHLVRLVGAGYLVYLGAQTWRHARYDLDQAAATPGDAFRMGLLANFTNPKTAVFFASVFASALPVQAPLTLRVGVIAVMVMNALWFHAVFALLCSHPRIRPVIQRAKPWIDRGTGALLMAFGVMIVLQG